MRNGKHYVPIRMTKSSKERFVKMCKACNVPECTFLYWLVNDMAIRESPPQAYFDLNRLFTNTEINVGQVWLSSKDIPEPIRKKYHDLSEEIGKYDRKILNKLMFF